MAAHSLLGVIENADGSMPVSGTVRCLVSGGEKSVIDCTGVVGTVLKKRPKSRSTFLGVTPETPRI